MNTRETSRTDGQTDRLTDGQTSLNQFKNGFRIKRYNKRWAVSNPSECCTLPKHRKKKNSLPERNVFLTILGFFFNNVDECTLDCRM